MQKNALIKDSLTMEINQIDVCPNLFYKNLGINTLFKILIIEIND